MADIKLGIIGLSEGNGHPYSWSAIFNGYDANTIDECPFAAIPGYLKAQQFPRDAIDGFRVTHVWTQDRKVSEHIARCVSIEHVVNEAQEMLGHIDALLLARDDAEHHYDFAKPFIDAGLPIYIDKPIATTVKNLDRLYQSMQYDWQIFSCSALRFAKELQLTQAELETLGPIRHVKLSVPKSFDKYMIHTIDPLLSLLGDQGEIKDSSTFIKEDFHQLSLQWHSGLSASLTAYGALHSPIEMTLFAKNKTITLTFADAFNAFKGALWQFCQSIQTKKCAMDWALTRRMVETIEAGKTNDE